MTFQSFNNICSYAITLKCQDYRKTNDLLLTYNCNCNELLSTSNLPNTGLQCTVQPCKALVHTALRSAH